MSVDSVLTVERDVCPVLNGRYRLLRPLGEGNMGKVFLAEDKKLCGKEWAIKQVDADRREMRLAEVEMLSRLDHPQLPRVVDFFFSSDSKKAYIVMDYVRGETLQTRFLRAGKSVPVQQALHYAIQICELYSYLHEAPELPIIHRDLKPEHILIDGRDQLKIVDFGISRQYKHGQLNDTLPYATLGFASPEQLQGRQTDARSDLYSIGALLYYLLSGGHYPGLEKMPAQRLREHVTPDVSELVMRLLATSPDERVQSASELQSLLRACQQRLASSGVEDISQVRQRTSSRVIACQGISPVSGCTHFCMLTAHVMAGMGYKVAILEMADHPCFSEIWGGRLAVGTSPTGSQEMADEPFHQHRAGVDYFPAHPSLRVQKLLFSGYDFLILDIGSQPSMDVLDEFERADVPVYVSFSGPPVRNRLRAFLSEQTPSDSRWQLALMMCETADEWQESVALRGLAVPACADPLQPLPAVAFRIQRWVSEVTGFGDVRARQGMQGISKLGRKLLSMFAF